MKDLTPVAEGDVVLKQTLEQRKRRAERGLPALGPTSSSASSCEGLAPGVSAPGASAPAASAPNVLAHGSPTSAASTLDVRASSLTVPEGLALGARPDERAERVKLTSEEREARRIERCRACEGVAYDILEEARTALAVRFRFLDQALWRMPLVASYDMFGIASDGRRLVFDPTYVVDRFKLSPNEVVRDVAHCLFHCIFRHPFMLYAVLRQPWDVACDIAIEVMLLDLLGEAFPSNMDRRARQSLRVIRTQLGGVITAERLYHFFADAGNHTDLKSLAPMFFHDTHGLWYGDEGTPDAPRDAQAAAAPREGAGQREGALPSYGQTETIDGIAQGPVEIPLPDWENASGGEGEREGAANEDTAGDGAPGEKAPRAPGESGEDAGGSTAGEPAGCDAAGNATGNGASAREDDRDKLARQWEDVSRRIQVELETHLATQGEGAGNLVAGLRALHRESYDYAQFLARFATLHERMLVNDEEFDYIYYTYGLARYGNMPLIEPLEYKEDRSVRDFVIAIDTSESCSGDVVQAFMRKTYNILKQSENFHSRVNIHVVQCDARVQEDVAITSLDQLELYLSDLQLKGFGGTDFRPVFDYVDMLVEKGELGDLRGLVYFTDGQGTFPRRPPRYDAVFAFLDDGYSDPEVPPWAFKVFFAPSDMEEVSRA